MPNDKAKSKPRQLDEGHFFAELEGQIVRRLKAEAGSQEGRDVLLRDTGIRDQKLIEELGRLGITSDGILALRVFPLALVAWAEGSADVRERQAVMAEAIQLGITDGSAAWILLDQWLDRRPPGLGVDAWRRYVHSIFADMSDVAQKRIIELTQRQMTSIAKASGGHLGFGKVSKKEQAVIDQIVTAMQRQR
ncbi:hypothetical protein Poly51_55370 [Rubripirellula tenax]|uniref:Uncharacterized protein n=1 Tax=Rubripirellula tenax TaxID=2528015 RepID=A0A5C6EB02_9BACT|nr:hypothetical protein [Rubripirellula tenax]TWU46142.1 hypothetical protein Poly51_55370 [Rubripirellula tenax]